MIGRGSFGNPWLFEQSAAALSGRDIPPLPPFAERWDTAVRQVEPVSYTHLDVYKRQRWNCPEIPVRPRWRSPFPM